MAKIGLAYPCWAEIASESTSELPTYNTGFAIGKAVRADLAIAFTEGQLYADNVLSEDVSEFSSGTITTETDNLTIAQMGTIYGATIVDNELGNGADDTPPYGGFGYYQVLMVSGVKKYRAFYYPKVKAKMGDETAQTKGNSITLGTTPIIFTVFKPDYGKWRYVKEFSTEATAKAYIQSKLNVATWYPVNVQVQGATTGEGASPTGTTMVAAGEDFVLQVSGTPTALYDNGVESKSSIAADKYTVADIDAAHNIAVIF
jgi:hypothetical protein